MEQLGRVHSVNVSAGGVPKLPVGRAWVSRLGLEGDGQRERTVHGGPHRAVCLYALEAIERLQADGHPVEPGSVGENVTTLGIEWSLLPIGTRARIGQTLELELASPTAPCSTQKANFRDGRFSRISIDHHPADSRMYARVVREGEVKAGDPITVIPRAADSRALEELLLGRLDRAVARSALAAWRTAAALGHDVRIVDDGELVMAASPELPGPRFNQALGLARLPNLIGEATRFFDDHACSGWIVTEHEPWPGARPEPLVDVLAAATAAVAETPPPPGFAIRQMTKADLPGLARLWAATPTPFDLPAAVQGPLDEAMLDAPHSFRLIAERDGQLLAFAALHVTHHVGWLRGAVVAPSTRGRGLQRALIAARARLAAGSGCDVLGAWAEAGCGKVGRRHGAGLHPIGRRQHHLYQPPASDDER